MTSATLAEQIGAMSLIDGLRRRQMVVQEHLDLPQRRAEVARRIRDYYESKNQAVDALLVEQGVREYFDRRLSFEAPKPDFLPGLLARVYITKKRWIKPVAIGVTALALLAGGTYFHLQRVEAAHIADVQKAVQQFSLHQDNVRAEIGRQGQKISEYSRVLDANPLLSASRLLSTVSEVLTQTTPLVLDKVSTDVTAKSRTAIHEAVSRHESDLQKADQSLRASAGTLVRVGKLIDVWSKFREITGQSGYTTARGNYPAIQNAETAARQAIEQADRGVPAASNAVNRLGEIFADSARIQTYVNQLNMIRDIFVEMRLVADDHAQVEALYAQVGGAIQKLDVEAAQKGIDELHQVLSYAETPLTLNVVDRSGVKSGVERNYDQSGGKSWYLIVEATDPSGRVVPVPVTSVESGVKAYATLFGVRVSRIEYERIKADKQADGHVDDKLMGRKTARSLSIRFGPRTATKPDMILEW